MGALKLLSLISVFTILISQSNSLPFREVLGSDDFAIVGVRNCSISTETAFEDDHCCYHMSDDFQRVKPECTKRFAVLYVPSEPDSKEQPRIMSIFYSGNQNSLVYSVRNIGYPLSNETIVMTTMADDSFSIFSNNSNHVHVSHIVDVVYDHLSRYLYIIYKNDLTFNRLLADVYLIEPADKPYLRHTFLHRIDVHDYFLNSEWSSDIYSQKFYYHKSEFDANYGRHISKVYSIPYASLTYNLKHGIGGSLEKEFTHGPGSTRFNVQVTNGLIFGSAVEQQPSKNKFMRYLASISRDVRGTKCPSNQTRAMDFFFVLTGWELCKLRDGDKADLNACVIPSVLDSSSAESSSSGSGFLWAIIIAVIVNAIILLIILFVLCRRKKADKYDNGLYTSGKPSHSALLSPEEIFQRRRTTSTLTEF